MDRNKLLAIVVGGLTAAGAVAFLAGNAQAASWHDYTGDVYAGHAYGLAVPAGARAYEISLSGDGNQTARVATYGPDGAKLGFYSLSTSLASASVVSPAEAPAFRAFVTACFTRRRKQLRNVVIAATGRPAAAVLAGLGQLGLDPTARPETLAPEQFARLLRWGRGL